MGHLLRQASFSVPHHPGLPIPGIAVTAVMSGICQGSKLGTRVVGLVGVSSRKAATQVWRQLPAGPS